MTRIWPLSDRLADVRKHAAESYARQKGSRVLGRADFIAEVEYKWLAIQAGRGDTVCAFELIARDATRFCVRSA